MTTTPRYLLQAPLDDELGARVVDVSARVRTGKITPKQSDEVSDLICEMTESTMRHFFARPAKAFGLGMIQRGLIDQGINITIKTVRTALRQVLPKLTPEQFREVADYLDEALPPPKPARKSA